MQNFTLLRELGPRAQAGAAQARHLGDDRGVAAVGRVRAERRQHRRDPVRARHPHVRDGDAQHLRHLGDSGGQEAEPPAGHRRSEPRRRTPRHGGADGARGGRRRRRRPDHRSALRSRPRAERRRAVDVPGAVRSADGGAAHHRAGDRPQHLPRAGRAARMGREADQIQIELEFRRLMELPVIQPGARADARQPPIFREDRHRRPRADRRLDRAGGAASSGRRRSSSPSTTRMCSRRRCGCTRSTSRPTT